MPEKEILGVDSSNIEINSKLNDGSFKGMLSVFGVKDYNGNIAQKGCFSEYHHNATKVPMFKNHNENVVIGHMYVWENNQGLEMKGKFNLNTSDGKDSYENLKAGDVDGFSMGFYVMDCDYDNEGWRVLKNVKVVEGSQVPFPANPLALGEACKIGGKMKIKEASPEILGRIRKDLDTLASGDIPDTYQPKKADESIESLAAEIKKNLSV